MEKSERAVIKAWLRQYRTYKARVRYLRNGPVNKQKEYEDAARKVRSLNLAWKSIGKEERKLLRARFIKKKNWSELAAETHYSERWLREKCNRAIDKLAAVIFVP